VKSVDPFNYPVSASPHYPKDFRIDLGPTTLVARAHIWPPLATTPEYRLGGQAAARQGFYFYRNDRLIQAGGWNDVRTTGAEPHLSLARIEIDLPAAAMKDFPPTTQKSGVDVPRRFKAAVLESRSGNATWSDYIRDAKAAYSRNEPGDAVVLPGSGFAAPVRRRARSTLKNRGETERPVKLVWQNLEPDKLFDLRPDEDLLVLNRRFRQDLLGQGSGAAARALQTALFLLLRDDFDRKRRSAKTERWLSACNSLLAASI
jgi:hypothetical protein